MSNGNAKPRIYLETSVLSACAGDNSLTNTNVARELFKAIMLNRIEPFTSQYAIDELEQTKEPKLSQIYSVLMHYENIVVLGLDDKDGLLADEYIAAGILTANHFEDARHIAVASITGMDAIATFNQTHIAKEEKVSMIPSVNLRYGYNVPAIPRAEDMMRTFADLGNIVTQGRSIGDTQECIARCSKPIAEVFQSRRR